MTYQANLTSLRQHPVPQWYQDAKLGIFIHWGLYSVPAWAPTGYSIRDLLRKMRSGEVEIFESPYAEWYQNNRKLEGSRTRQYHQEKYGINFPYENFQPIFNQAIQMWNPGEWAELFKDIGARYVVLTTKHHDGFTLWPSQHKNPFREDYVASRDIVGELTSAVRSLGMHMGVYYSGGLDWTFNGKPIREIADLFTQTPQQSAYVRYCMAHWRELIERYEPEILWNDISMPLQANVEALFADYYNRFPQGVVNDRFQKGLGPLTGLFKLKPLKKWLSKMMITVLTSDTPSGMERRGHCDYVTPEYSSFRQISSRKWESTRGMGRSFGFNQQEQEEDMISLPELVHQFVDIVSKNGNLLLNVGPMPDGSIPTLQLDRLKGLGKWLQTNGEAIFDTSPWTQAEGLCLDGEAEISVRFTQKDEKCFATLLGVPAGVMIRLKGLRAAEGTSIHWLGEPSPLEWRQSETDLLIFLEAGKPNSTAGGNACCLSISPQPEAVQTDE